MKASARIQTTRFGLIVSVIALSLMIVLPAKAITWGWPDGNLHPNVGALVVRLSDSGELFQVCSGTLIYPNIFLTAGHCTDGLQYLIDSDAIEEEIYVNFDEDALNEATKLAVETWITHPNYTGFLARSNVYDVGLLILAEDAGITPAILPEEGFLDDLRKGGKLREGKEEADFTVVGYGGTLSWPPPEQVYEDKRQYAFSEYQALLKSWLRLSQNAATDDGGTGYGDSGGPTFWTTDQGDILVAITSWGDAPCVSSEFNYRVDTADTLDFIAVVAVAEGWLEE